MTTPGYESIMQALNGRQSPTVEQRLVIESLSPVILVVAGAGSGKTATMTNRIAYHVAQGHVRPDEVLGLTFTRKAAGELAERTQRALDRVKNVSATEHDDDVSRANNKQDFGGELRAAYGTLSEGYGGRRDLARPTITTYNSFAAEIAASYGLLVGEDPAARLMTDGERWQIMDSIIEDWTEPIDESLADSARTTIVSVSLMMASSLTDNQKSVEDADLFFKEQLDTIARFDANKKVFRGMPEASAAWRSLREGQKSLTVRRAVLPFVEHYYRYKKARGLMEFSDQISTASTVLEQYPEIGAQISAKYRLVLLDEYQDTSSNQEEFLRRALGKPVEGTFRSVCAVGDPNQAIYGWRGASANALASFATHFGSALGRAEHLTLSTSFRNDRAILDAANVLSGRLSTSHVTVPRLVAGPSAGEGRVTEIRTLLREDSYRGIALRIEQVMDEVASDPARAESSNPQDREAGIAILCRKRKYMEWAANALEERGILYEIVGGDSLIMRPEILTIRAALTVIAYPKRDDLAIRLLTYIGADAHTLRVLSEWAKQRARDHADLLVDTATHLHDARREYSLVEAIDDLPPREWATATRQSLTTWEHERLEYLRGTLASLRTSRHMPLPDLIAQASSQLGIDGATATRMRGSQRVRTSLDSFIRLGGTYATEHPQAQLADFIMWLEAVEAQETGGEEESGQDLIAEDVDVHPGIVQILTVHSAKGLEWRDLVVIPEMVDGEFSEKTSGAKVWMKDAREFPFPLRADRDDLPSFNVCACSDKFDAAEHYLQFKDNALLDFENQERGRLAYVACTRPMKELLLAGYALKDTADAARRLSKHITSVKRGKAAQDSPVSLIRRSSYINFLRETAVSGSTVIVPVRSLAPDYSWPEWLENEAPEEMTAAELAAVAGPDASSGDLEPVPDYRAEEALKRWPRDIRRMRVQDLPHVPPEVDWKALSANVEIVQKDLASHQGSENPMRPYYTATDLVHLSEAPDEFTAQIRRPIPQRPSAAARRGTRIHTRIAHFFDRPATLDLDAVLEFGEMPIDTEYLTAPEEERFFRTFEESKWASYQPVAIEQSLEIVVAEQIFRCTIDAVLDTRCDPDLPDIMIVDWKTGRRPRAEQILSRQLQLALYRLAWAKSKGVELSAIGAAFVYLAEDEEHRDLFAPQLSEEQIEELVRQTLEPREQVS